MNVFLRVVRLLTMVVWVGGLVFFAFVVAPVAFHVLPSTHEAGTVVGATLRVLNRIGPYFGYAFILSALGSQIKQKSRSKLLTTQILLVFLMLSATAYVRTSIVPAMERDRVATGGDVDAADLNSPARLDFERLHPLSEKIEGSALLLGFAVVVMMGFEDRNTGGVRPA